MITERKSDIYLQDAIEEYLEKHGMFKHYFAEKIVGIRSPRFSA